MDIKTVAECREILRKLRSTQEQHKDDATSTGGVRVSDLARDAGDAIGSLIMLTESKKFPILGTADKIPWSVVEPHRVQAEKNHFQTLERLAERGGLCYVEVLAVLENRPWGRMDETTAKWKVMQIVAEQYST